MPLTTSLLDPDRPRRLIMTSLPSIASPKKSPTSRGPHRAPMVLRIPGPDSPDSDCDVFVDDATDDGKGGLRGRSREDSQSVPFGSSDSFSSSSSSSSVFTLGSLQRGRKGRSIETGGGSSSGSGGGGGQTRRAFSPPPSNRQSAFDSFGVRNAKLDSETEDGEEKPYGGVTTQSMDSAKLDNSSSDDAYQRTEPLLLSDAEKPSKETSKLKETNKSTETNKPAECGGNQSEILSRGKNAGDLSSDSGRQSASESLSVCGGNVIGRVAISGKSEGSADRKSMPSSRLSTDTDRDVSSLDNFKSTPTEASTPLADLSSSSANNATHNSHVYDNSQKTVEVRNASGLEVGEVRKADANNVPTVSQPQAGTNQGISHGVSSRPEEKSETNVRSSYEAGTTTATQGTTIIVESKPGPEIVSVLKRTDSGRKTRARNVALGEMTRQPSVTLCEPEPSSNNVSEQARVEDADKAADGGSRRPRIGSASSRASAGNSQSSTKDGAEDDAAAVPTPRRRISFPMDSVLTAVIQDGDIPELLRILIGREGPGLVRRKGGGGESGTAVGGVVGRGSNMGEAYGGGEGRIRGLGGGRGPSSEVVDVVRQTNHVGLTALHHAVLANNLDAAKLLLCHGASVNAQDVHGFSPLHTAAACGFLSLASLLLLFGADVFCLTADHELPIDVAKDVNVIRLLSHEMSRLVQKELWIQAVLKAQAEELWVLVRKLLACLLLLFLKLCMGVGALWKKHRKTD